MSKNRVNKKAPKVNGKEDAPLPIEQAATHVALPVGTFNRAMQVLEALPYTQVAGLMAQIQQAGRQIHIEEAKANGGS